MQTSDLKNAGLKVTMPRVKILEILEKNQKNHFTAEEIYQILRENEEEVGLATVYRVLNQFASAGLVIRHHFTDNHSVYELNQGHHHDHIICINCGYVEEFTDPEIEKKQQSISEKYGFHLVDHTFILYAECKKENCEHRKHR